MTHHWTIYMYTFPNGKKYIGKTNRSLSERQGSNFCQYKRCVLLWKAIQKYGPDSIEQEILAEGDMEDYMASELEQEYIAHYQTNCNRYNNPTFGYNLTDGGEGMSGWKPNAEQYKFRCNVLAESAAKRRGVPFSDEHREKLSRAKRGIPRGPLSEETKRKLSLANSRENMSPETHIRRSESKKKKMRAIHTETGERIDFNSVRDAADYFGVHLSSIYKCRHGLIKPIRGYKFYYLSTDND